METPALMAGGANSAFRRLLPQANDEALLERDGYNAVRVSAQESRQLPAQPQGRLFMADANQQPQAIASYHNPFFNSAYNIWTSQPLFHNIFFPNGTAAPWTPDQDPQMRHRWNAFEAAPGDRNNNADN
jgi:hypothetical protein